MARRSPYEHLKPAIEEEFGKGRTPVEVLRMFPQIESGQSTVYKWYNEYKLSRKNSRNDSTKTESNTQSQPGQAIANSISPQGKLLHLIPDSDAEYDSEDDRLSDIAWAKKQIKKHVLRPNRDSAVVVQALNAFLRAIQIERSLPADEPDDSELLTTRASRTAELLNAARDRRAREDIARQG